MLFHTACYYDLNLNKIKVMKKFILLLVFVFSIGFIEGQTTFFKTIGGNNEYSHYIEQTTDGGYIIGGTGYGSGVRSGYVIKTNEFGDTLWTRTYGRQSTFYSGKQTSDGGYVFAGSEKPVGSMYYNMYILKIDSIGTIQWQKSIGGANEDVATCIKQTTDGGYIISGYTNSYGSGSYDFCALKLDFTGNLVWDNIIGSTGYEKAYSVSEINSGGYIFTGRTSMSQLSLIKLNTLGVLQWIRQYNGSSYTNGQSVIETNDGGFMISGDILSSGSNLSIYKTDSLGIVTWNKIYSSTIGFQNTRMTKTTAGNYIISSTIGDNMLLTLIDSSGNEIWSRKMSFNDSTSGGYMTSMGSYSQETSDGGYIFTGNSMTPSNGAFIYIVKTDTNGNSGCDTAITLTIITNSPIISAPSVTSISGITVGTPTYLSMKSNNTLITYCTSVGINELQSSPQISVYPNPSSGQFNFSGLDKESKIEVFDITGRIIYQSIAKSDFETINISDKAKGIYFYRITNEMKLLQSGKICVQ